jgi:hypothetical protein
MVPIASHPVVPLWHFTCFLVDDEIGHATSKFDDEHDPVRPRQV